MSSFDVLLLVLVCGQPCTTVLKPNTQYIAAAPVGSRECPMGCNPGYADVGGECVACPAGSFKAEAGPYRLNSTESKQDLSQILQRDCLQCPANTFSLAASSRCNDCRDSCPDGYIINGTCSPGSVQDALCSPCPLNTYKDSSSATCIPCDDNSQSLGVGSPSATSCKCKEGFTIVDTFDGSVTTRVCQQCPANTFSLFGEDYCSPCDSNAQAPAGSTSAAACQCNAGYVGDNGEGCAACASGTYKSSKGPQVCSLCRDKAEGLDIASTPLASTSESACVCPVGYEKDSSAYTCQDVDECGKCGWVQRGAAVRGWCGRRRCLRP